jgi:hypothetical protein
MVELENISELPRIKLGLVVNNVFVDILYIAEERLAAALLSEPNAVILTGCGAEMPHVGWVYNEETDTFERPTSD